MKDAEVKTIIVALIAVFSLFVYDVGDGLKRTRELTEQERRADAQFLLASAMHDVEIPKSAGADQALEATKDAIDVNREAIETTRVAIDTVEMSLNNRWSQWGAVGLIMLILVFLITRYIPEQNRRHDAQAKSHDETLKETRQEFTSVLTAQGDRYATTLNKRDEMFLQTLNRRDDLFAKTVAESHRLNEKLVDKCAESTAKMHEAVTILIGRLNKHDVS